MPEPIHIGRMGNVRQLIRPTVATDTPRPGECPTHPGNTAAFCGPCAGERKAADPNARREMYEQRVRLDCDRRFPRRFRNAEADHPAVIAWIAQVLEDPDDAPSLLISGRVGTGKTHQAYGALRAVAPALHGRDWIAATYPDLLTSLRPRPGGEPERRVDHYRQASVLLLDDLGIAKASEWVEETTYALIDGRYIDMMPSIFTTNLTIGELRGAIGDRIASRLAESCTRVVLEGPDRRRAA
jgi:DNA replication protein DnaC